MHNNTPMKRSTWARRPPPSEKELNREQRIAQRAQRAIDSVAVKSAEKKQGNRQVAHAVCAPVAMNSVAAMPKVGHQRSEPYRRLVAHLVCAHCGIEGYSQAAHGDFGKGLSIKADDRTCYPACAPHDGRQGCHYLIGTSGTYTREERRALDEQYGAQTRAKIINLGLWPAGLPMWSDQIE